MFTGIIKDLGRIKGIVKNKEGLRIEISTKLINEINIDDSVSVNGVCQTVIKKSASTIFVQAISVTLEKTNFKNLKENLLINLELALQPIERLGGHIVQGHVNGVAKIKKISKQGDSKRVEIEFPKEFAKYLIKEGSIALDGISLTISNIYPLKGILEVSLIPHTLEYTNAKIWKLGTEINLEVDLLAKYVENLLFYSLQRKNFAKGSISTELLNNFLKE